MSNQTASGPGGPQQPSRLMRQDVLAGFFLIAVALFFLWQASPLPLGSVRAMGPGMLPVAVAVILGAGGLLLSVLSWIKGGAAMTRAHLRGLFFVLGGIVVFGLTIRTLGLIVAGPLSMIIASFATDEARPVEAVVFAAVMTAFCIALFKYALGLPIPVVAFM